MSKAFYKSREIPKLLWRRVYNLNDNSTSTHKKSIEVWNTTCIVTNFGKNLKCDDDTAAASPVGCSVLINPSNPELSGVSNFPYFPRGGPVPKERPKSMHKDWQPLGYVSNWGGMEVGTGMLYPASVVDGLVHQLGGKLLEFECKFLRTIRGGCPVGRAVTTYTGGRELKERYDRVVHTTPPFYDHHLDPVGALGECYTNATSVAFGGSRVRDMMGGRDGGEGVIVRVACPLLGAGARGFPVDVAIQVAAEKSIEWKNDDGTNDGTRKESILAFGIPDLSIAESLSRALEVKTKS